MPVYIDWEQIALRLVLTMAAGAVIGFDRGEHGHPAGMRTTILVCLAASLSMIQANLLMNTVGKGPGSFVVLDLMRLPLGILSGMGFIGAGAILRKDNLVLGVTTAATLWFTTVMGLCFGGGQIYLGLVALGLGWFTLWGLKFVEKAMPQDVRATLILFISGDNPSDQEIRARITESGARIISCGVTYSKQAGGREIRMEVQRRIKGGNNSQMPDFVPQLVQYSNINKVEWEPHGAAARA